MTIKLSKGFKYSLIIIFLLTSAYLAFDLLWPKFDYRDELKAKISILEKKAKESAERLAKFKAESLKAQRLKDEKIVELRAEILKVDRIKERLARVDEEKDLKIRKLVAERESLKDPQEVIINLESLVKAWEERFWNERRDKEESEKVARKWAAIADLNLRKYLEEKELREWTEMMVKQERDLRIDYQGLVKEDEKIIRALSLKLNLKNVLYTAGGIAFGLIIGGKK